LGVDAIRELAGSNLGSSEIQSISLNCWLAGKVKPTFQSLLKVRDFLERQVQIRGGIAPIGYVPIRGNNPNGRKREGTEMKGEK
jgi:hypothetical protein